MCFNMTCMISQTEQYLGAPIIGPGQVLGYIIPRIPSYPDPHIPNEKKSCNWYTLYWSVIGNSVCVFAYYWSFVFYDVIFYRHYKEIHIKHKHDVTIKNLLLA